MTYYYLDENKNPIRCDLKTWTIKFDNQNRVVKQEEVNDKYVSTMFLGLDHNYLEDNDNPHIFETMIFQNNDWQDIYCERYSTYQEAEEGHEKAVQLVKQGFKWE